MRKLWWMGLIGLWAFAFTQNTELPTKPKNWVTDRANLLSAEQENRLNLLLSQLERETGVEMAVVTVRRVQGTTPKQFATELFNRWGIGKKGADNGVLLLISLGDRRIEVETGYSLEAILPDSVVGAILDEQVIPRFRNGDYAGGIIAGAEAIAERVRKAQSQGAYEPTFGIEAPRANPMGRAVLVLFLIGAGTMVVLAVVAYNRPPRCPQCRRPMRLLSEAEDDLYLTPVQTQEEQIGSINYYVWRCDECEELEIFPRENWFSSYKRCPQCGARTLKETARIVHQPTYSRTGLEVVSEVCVSPACNHKSRRERVLPRLQRPPVVVGGTHSGGWGTGTRSGGWGGGGWSGGGSFGGFGGGRSGGGGAGRSW